MLNKNESYEVKIFDLGENGEGIGKIDGYTIFVHGGIPGDLVMTKIIKVNKQYAIGIVQEILESSPIRQTPACPYLTCGGCQTQMIDYDAQLKIKKQLVEATLERIGGFKNIQVNDVIGMDEPKAYRNKSQYPVRLQNNQMEIGFYKQRTHDVVPIENCMVQHDLVNQVMLKLMNLLNASHISIYDEKTRKGFLRHIVTRISYKTDDMMLIFVTNGQGTETDALKTISKDLNDLFPQIKSFVQNINKSQGNRVMGYENITLQGHDKITDYIESLQFEISPLSFLQVNPVQTEQLYKTALKMAHISKSDTVFDVYCGIGTISLFLAQHAKKVYGIEIIDVAIEDAKNNAINNDISNTEFLVGEAEVVIPKLYKQGISADVVVVDPPRKGCEAIVLETLLEMAPKTIVYVSCKVSTLARDLKILSEKYEVVEVQPVDMFPHTTHVETVVRLQRKSM